MQRESQIEESVYIPASEVPKTEKPEKTDTNTPEVEKVEKVETEKENVMPEIPEGV